jgi:hypothetical protein
MDCALEQMSGAAFWCDALLIGGDVRPWLRRG